MAEPTRRSFGLTVLSGVAGAALSSMAAGRDWAGASGTAVGGGPLEASVRGSSSAPLVLALAVVSLAAWGVVLVLRGRVRRLVAVVGALAAAGAVVSSLLGLSRLRSDAVAAVVARGGQSTGVDTSLSPWYVVCVLASLVCLAAFAAAVVHAPGWPTMSSRYDAPGAQRDGRRDGSRDGQRERRSDGGTDAGTDGDIDSGAELSEREMWRALDDGRDPTA